MVATANPLAGAGANFIGLLRSLRECLETGPQSELKKELEGNLLRKPNVPGRQTEEGAPEHPAERFLARVGDTLEVKDTSGRVVDVWRVLSSASAGTVHAVSMRTGRNLTIPTDLFELKKYAMLTDSLATQVSTSKYFDFQQEVDGTWSIDRVPILAGKDRGYDLYDEAFLDEVVATFWADNATVLASYPGSDRFGYFPTVIVGHTSDDPKHKEDQRESIGRITAMWREGITIMAKMSGFDSFWIEKLRAGALPNRSCELKAKSKRIVSVALLSEEPFFRMPQLRKFTADEEISVFTFLGENTMVGDPSQVLGTVLQHLQAAAGAIQEAIQNGPGAVGGGNPSAGTPGPGAAASGAGEPPKKTFKAGGAKSVKEVEDEEDSGGTGADKPKQGDAPALKVDAKGRPTETASSSGPLGDKPTQEVTVNLSKADYEKMCVKMRESDNRIAALERANTDLGEKCKFAVGHIETLTAERKKLDVSSKLRAMVLSGIPLGGQEGVDKYTEIITKLAEKDATAMLEQLAALPKTNLGGKVRVVDPANSLREKMDRFSADFDGDPDRYINTGYKDGKTFAASMAIGDLMAENSSSSEEEEA